jgi:hypothetical protein
MRYGFGGEEPMSLTGIGRILGISRDRVRNLERDGLAGLHLEIVDRGAQVPGEHAHEAAAVGAQFVVGREEGVAHFFERVERCGQPRQ